MYLPFCSNTEFEINFGFTLYACICIDLISFSTVALILKGRCNLQISLSTFLMLYPWVNSHGHVFVHKYRCCSLYLGINGFLDIVLLCYLIIHTHREH